MIRRVALLAVLLFAVVPVATAAAADRYTIRAVGGKFTPGIVQNLGPFEPSVDGGTEAAITVFGQPSSRAETKTACRLGWRNLGLKVLFANFGGGPACQFGKAQTASAFGKIWNTSKGLKVGSSTKTLRKLYPGAKRKGRTYRLISGRTIGNPRVAYSVLAAKTNGRKVTSFKLFIGAAGE